ncbi:hypothetical protein [Nitratifractor sp.]|uniref:hypothetical protein n=1 Tax=Nitratifractor sp. TaxID=2268144 RepID=UPI0025E44AE3|nr:hypothetical protein [Nitratifractor sp.]
MIRPFYTLMAFLLGLVLLAAGHYARFDRDGVLEKQRALVAVTGLDAPALSVSWFEPRERRYEAAVNPAYPELLPPDRLDFVYGDLYGK